MILSLLLFTGAIAGLFIVNSYLIVVSYASYDVYKKGMLNRELFNNKVFSILNTLLIYSIISAIANGVFIASLWLIIMITILFLSYFIFDKYVENLKADDIEKIFNNLFKGYLAALVFITFEIATKGLIYRTIRLDILHSTKYVWFLSDLNRGVSFLNLLFWPILAFLSRNKPLWVVILFFVVNLIVTIFSDSLASVVGLILSIIAFSLVSYKKQMFSLIKFSAVLSIILMPAAFYYMDKEYLAINFPFPPSAEHRLYIWNYIANLIFSDVNQFVFGNGFNTSRFWKAELSTYHPVFGSSFPLHPHNHILQILFELGVFGFILYFALLKRLFNYAANLPKNELSILSAQFVVYFMLSVIAYGIWQQWWIAAQISAVLIFKLYKKYLNESK